MIQFGLSTLSLAVWLTIGVSCGILVHLLDRKDGEALVPTLISSMVGALLGGFISAYVFQGTSLTISDTLISATFGFLLAITTRILLGTSEQIVTVSSPIINVAPRFELAYLSQISKPSPNSHLQDVRRILKQAQYPMSKADLIRFAEQSGVDRHDLTIIEGFEDHIYSDLAEAEQQII